jgi:hypothetical protein
MDEVGAPMAKPSDCVCFATELEGVLLNDSFG